MMINGISTTQFEMFSDALGFNDTFRGEVAENQSRLNVKGGVARFSQDD